jgi:TPR repeat protein
MARIGDWISIVLSGAMVMAAAGVPAHADDKSKAAEILRKRLEGDVDSGKLQKKERLPPANVSKDQTIFTTPVDDPKKQMPSEGLTLLERIGQSLPDLPAEKPFKGKVDDAYGAYQRGLYLSALNIALPKAQLGDAAAQTLVAELMNNGLGVRRNPTDAAFWYEQAAKAGDANAQYKYALMLLTGENVKQDKKAADVMMRKAAQGGSREAQFNVAQLLSAADPGEKGLKEALPYYEKAAFQGVPDAQYALSQLYYHMDLPREKRQQARDWLLKAALAGYDTAQYDMAMWLINGVAGERNYEEGFRWMQIAANRGHVVAQNKLAKLYVNAIGTRPDPIEATKWYVISRKAGLADLELEDFFLGIDEATQKEGVARADAFMAQRS